MPTGTLLPFFFEFGASPRAAGIPPLTRGFLYPVFHLPLLGFFGAFVPTPRRHGKGPLPREAWLEARVHPFRRTRQILGPPDPSETVPAVRGRFSSLRELRLADRIGHTRRGHLFPAPDPAETFALPPRRKTFTIRQPFADWLKGGHYRALLWPTPIPPPPPPPEETYVVVGRRWSAVRPAPMPPQMLEGETQRSSITPAGGPAATELPLGPRTEHEGCPAQHADPDISISEHGRTDDQVSRHGKPDETVIRHGRAPEPC